jgi:citrate lyase beta subunit
MGGCFKMKETNVDRLKLILRQMKSVKENEGVTEIDHQMADDLLIQTIEVLQELENTFVLQVVGEIIDTFNSIEKWYA